MIDICRRAGFEPVTSETSFHTAWDLGLPPDEVGFSFCPASATASVPEGLATVGLKAPAPSLPTMLSWHRDSNVRGVSPLVEVVRELASASGWDGISVS